jgi:hypothetical protein
MPFYPSPQSLLADARLRLDGLPASRAVLVVEGPDDQRLFSPRVLSSPQIVVSGGRGLLLAAYSEASSKDLASIVFITDCDYEVARGSLRPGPSLIITKNVDAESDLLELGLFDRLGIELVPRALSSDAAAREVGAALRQRSVAFAEVLSQVRRVALEHGVELDVDDIKYRRTRVAGTKDVNGETLVKKLGQRSSHCGLTPARFLGEVRSMPTSYMFCNGHDLINALHFVLREDFDVSVERVELARLLRIAASEVFPSWTVVRRLIRWQVASGRAVLR